MEMIPDPWKPSEFQDEQVRHLYAGIRRLPPLECALVSLYLDDVSTCDIAEILGISEVNVRVKLHRAKKNLKEIMEHSDGTG
jgi:RNA polymerase sigma-70 factor (ECF subfamily)